MCGRIVALIAIIALLPVRAFGEGPPAQLLHIATETAGDGSLRITLAFDRAAPETRIVRSTDHLVHVVLIKAVIGRNVHPTALRFGELARGTFADFVGIGMRLDLQLRDRVRVRAQAEGNAIVVDIPAARSDQAAAPAPLPAAAEAASITVFVPLSYADVSEVAGVLVKGAAVPSNDFFAAVSPFAAPAGGAGATTTITAAPTYVSIPAATILPKDSPAGVRFDDHVAVDRRLNAVILTGTPSQVDAYKQLVARLDVPPRSVLLDTQIVELTETGAKNLGIDYSPGGTVATATLGSTTGNKPVIAYNLSATVSALAQTGQAKILARPRIMSLNNRPAAILSGQAVPIFTSVVVPGAGGNIVNQQVQYINVGVSLQILPRIADDGRVTTQIFCEVSSIIDYILNTPQIAVRQELTSAMVNDSESLIVGGLLQENEIRSLRKVPGLGNIPLLGGFFRDTTNTSQNTNLYIVITPHILSNGQDTSRFDLAPQPLATIPPADPNLVPGPLATPPPAPVATKAP